MIMNVLTCLRLKKEITPVDYVKLMIYSKEDIKKFIKSMRRVFNLFNSDPKFYMDRLQVNHKLDDIFRSLTCDWPLRSILTYDVYMYDHSHGYLACYES